MSISSILAKAGKSSLNAIDDQLVKIPFMREEPILGEIIKGNGFTMRSRIPTGVNKNKRNALLSALGIGGLSGAAYAMSEDSAENKRDREIAEWFKQNADAVEKDPDIAKWIYHDWPKGYKS